MFISAWNKQKIYKAMGSIAVVAIVPRSWQNEHVIFSPSLTVSICFIFYTLDAFSIATLAVYRTRVTYIWTK